MAPTAPIQRRERDLRLDFFRGLALFFIFIDHIPDNVFALFTLQAVGFSDAAEVFIFISGYAAGQVYGSAMDRQGVPVAVARIYGRVWQLYVAHVFLFVIFTAAVAYTVQTFNNPLYAEEMRVGDFLTEPHVAIVKALTLQFQPTFLDILPLYIVLLAVFPAVLLALRVSVWLALVPSLALYAGVQALDWSVPAYPEEHVWKFNPLAWQVLFVIGAACGVARQQGRSVRPRSRAITAVAAAIVAASAVIHGSWTIHWVYDEFPALLLETLFPINKTDLEPLRLIHFLALAQVVLAVVPRDSAWLSRPWVAPILGCGRNSLPIFCLGILLSLIGHFALVEFQAHLLLHVLVNGVGFGIMIATAWFLDWYKNANQARVSGAGVQSTQGAE